MKDRKGIRENTICLLHPDRPNISQLESLPNPPINIFDLRNIRISRVLNQ